ncbi:MAG: amidohydrolase [bacterium]
MKLRRLRSCLIVTFALALSLSQVSLYSQNGKTDLTAAISEDYEYLDALYQYLHTHPELSFHEQETAARLARELRDLNFDVTTNVGGHGLVGVLKNGAGPTVMIRTDLDGLPVLENTGVPYASKVKTKDDQGNEVSVMHACGHDVHMTVLTGTARLLAGLKDNWQGTLVVIGQPAEEKGAGAKAMIADGLFTRFPRPDYAIALHVSAALPAGTLAYREGYALANVDAVDIQVHGIGGHGAYPHTTKDPVVIAAQIVLALQTIVSREIKPTEPAVVTVGSIHGGTKHNIISDGVHLQLTLRSYSDQVRAQTIAAIKRITKGIAIAAGLPEDKLPTVSVRDEYTPATYNDPQLTARLAKSLKPVLGEHNVFATEPVMGGEDFGRYGRQEPKIPICMFWLGTVSQASYNLHKNEGTPLPSLHSSLFAPVPEPTIKTGVKAMTTAALSLFEKK